MHDRNYKPYKDTRTRLAIVQKNLFRAPLRRRGVSLAELLVASLLAALLLFGLTAMAYLPMRATRANQDLHAAQNRAELIFAILKEPLEQCGYGLPKSAEDYQKAFGGASPPPFNWPGPISVTATNDLGYRENSNCRIAYGVGSEMRTTLPVSSPSGYMAVTVSGKPKLLQDNIFMSDENDPDDGGGNENHVKNWILLGAMTPRGVPMAQYAGHSKAGDGNTTLFLKCYMDASDGETIYIPENDELFYLRAMDCKVTKNNGETVFAVNQHMGSGYRRRVGGVADVRFELDAGSRVLRVLTLTRGDNRYQEYVTNGTPEGWPEKYAASITDELRHYKLLASQASFSLKNW